MRRREFLSTVAAGMTVAGLPVAGLPVAGLPVAGLPVEGAEKPLTWIDSLATTDRTDAEVREALTRAFRDMHDALQQRMLEARERRSSSDIDDRKAATILAKRSMASVGYPDLVDLIDADIWHDRLSESTLAFVSVLDAPKGRQWRIIDRLYAVPHSS